MRRERQLCLQVGAGLGGERGGHEKPVDVCVAVGGGVVALHVPRGRHSQTVTPLIGWARRRWAKARVPDHALDVGKVLGEVTKDGGLVGILVAIDLLVAQVDRPRECGSGDRNEKLHIGELSDCREALLDAGPQRQEGGEVQTGLPVPLARRVEVHFLVAKAAAGRRHGAHSEHDVGPVAAAGGKSASLCVHGFG